MRDQTYTSDALTEQRICPGCKQGVVTENGGVVVAFGYVKATLRATFHADPDVVNHFSTLIVLNVPNATTRSQRTRTYFFSPMAPPCVRTVRIVVTSVDSQYSTKQS